MSHRRPGVRSHDDGGPGAVDAEFLAEGVDEFLGGIADAGMSEVAEVGEVFADLGVGEVEGFAELFGGDGAAVFALEGFGLAEVEGEAADGRVWGLADRSGAGRGGSIKVGTGLVH